MQEITRMMQLLGRLDKFSCYKHPHGIMDSNCCANLVCQYDASFACGSSGAMMLRQSVMS